MVTTLIRALPPFVLLFAPGAAMAHVSEVHESGFGHGFMHPMLGMDHVLAMLLVGALAFQIGGRALWLVPAAFVAMMAVGGVLGGLDVPMSFVELGIAASIVVFGAMLSSGARPSVAGAMALVGGFALFHGHAHGAGIPNGHAGLAFGLGFVVATATLHGLGIALSSVLGGMGERLGTMLVKASGATACAAGLGMLAGAI